MAAPTEGSEHFGHVSPARWEQLVRECREAVEAQTRVQWTLGDAALTIEPIQLGHRSPNDPEPGVRETLGVFAEEIGVELETLLTYRNTAAQWPKKRRRKHVSFTVHHILGGLQNRFEIIGDPPQDPRTGQRRWTCEQARRHVGWQVHWPRDPEEKAQRVRALTREAESAETAAETLMQRPEVVDHLVGNPSTWHTLSKARQQRDAEVARHTRERTPAVAEAEHTQLVAELLGSCSQFVAAINRTVPRIQGQLGPTDREAMHEALQRVRTAADWCQDAVDTGDSTLSDEIAEFLRGEEP